VYGQKIKVDAINVFGKFMRPLLIILFLTFSSDLSAQTTSNSNERRLRNKILACLDNKLTRLESSKKYQSTLREANIFYQTQKDSLLAFKEIKVPVERVFDKYIFFNRDSTKCLLMLLEKYPGDFHRGYLRIIRGDLNGKSKFKLGMHMLFAVEDIKPLFPKEYNAGARQYTFEMLSSRGRIAVLNYGNSKLKTCDIDESWWFKEE
jgi:hypothetical protein